MFWNKNKTVTITGETKPLDTPMITINPNATQPADEWVEVIGYKGTDQNMQCRDGFQYKLGATYIISDPSNVEICKNGYHLCKELAHVLNYYGDPFNHRYFKVRAVVRKSDLDSYDGVLCDKLVAKKIEILEELSIKEVYELYKNNECNCRFSINGLINSIDDFKLYIGKKEKEIVRLIKCKYIKALTDLGYSETFSTILINGTQIGSTTYAIGYYKYRYDTCNLDELCLKAKAFKEEGLSPDMCAYLLLK